MQALPAIKSASDQLHLSVDGSEEETILVNILLDEVTRLLGGLAEAWEVEVRGDAKAIDLKQSIQEKYGIDVALQRITFDNDDLNKGVKDILRIADFPDADSDPGQPNMQGKRVFLLPAIGMEKKFVEALGQASERSAQHAAKNTPVNLQTSPKSVMSKGWTLSPSLFSRPTSFWGEIQKRRQVVRRAETSKRKDGSMDDQGDIIVPLSDRIWFNLLASVFCLGNLVVIGLEADYTCWGKPNCKADDDTVFFVLDCFFAFIFVVETAIRIYSLNPVIYFLGDPINHPIGFNGLQIIDFLIVVARAVDTFAFRGEAGTRIKIISCFRILQIFRVCKAARMMKSLRELWLIIAGMGEMFKTVLWVMLLLLIVFWIFGILMTVVVGRSDEFFNYTDTDWSKDDYFGTVTNSAYSLFQIMTFSQWSSSIMRPVFDVKPWIFLIIVPFFCIATVGLLNIIVGVVVETTLLSANSNEEREAKELQKMHARVMESLKVVFEEADADKSGMLDRDELHRAMKKPTVRGRLHLLDIPVKDLDSLFDILDETGAGEIKTDAFFRGCSRLRGPALACDMHRMSVDFSRYITTTDSLVELSKLANEKLRTLLVDIEAVDRDIVRGVVDDVDPILKSRRKRSFKKLTMRKNPNEENDEDADDACNGRKKREHGSSIMEQTINAVMKEIGFNRDDYIPRIDSPTGHSQTISNIPQFILGNPAAVAAAAAAVHEQQRQLRFKSQQPEN